MLDRVVSSKKWLMKHLFLLILFLGSQKYLYCEKTAGAYLEPSQLSMMEFHWEKKVKAKINPFFSNAPFVYPMKTLENRKVSFLTVTQTGNYMFKVNNRNTRASCKICSRLTKKTPKQHQWHCSSVFIVDLKHFSHFVLVFLLLTVNI